jgi:hypothetical protein
MSPSKKGSLHNISFRPRRMKSENNHEGWECFLRLEGVMYTKFCSKRKHGPSALAKVITFRDQILEHYGRNGHAQ